MFDFIFEDINDDQDTTVLFIRYSARAKCKTCQFDFTLDQQQKTSSLVMKPTFKICMIHDTIHYLCFNHLLLIAMTEFDA